MPLKKNQTEAEALEQYRVAFENVEKQPAIATIMAEFGYDQALLTEGKTLLTKPDKPSTSTKKKTMKLPKPTKTTPS